MKSILFTLFFCLVFTPFLTGQWSQIETLKGGDIITDIIEFKNDIYISTSENSLFRSTDQGITWTQPKLPERWRIDGMTIYKDSLFAVVSGSLFKSADGLNWTQLPIFTTFINQIVTIEDTLYLSCYNGIWKSGNGGKDWIDINNSETVNGINCVAKNGNVLFAGGQSGKLYKSLNGGSSWETINTNTKYGISQTYVSNGCIFINITEKILKSEDNGLHWTSIAPSAYNGYFYLKNSVGFVASDNTVFKSIDNGVSWSSSSFKLPFSGVNTMFFNGSYVFVGFWGAGVTRNSISLNQEWITSNEGLMLMEIHKILEKDSIIYVGTDDNFVQSNNKEEAAWKAEKNYYNGTDGNARSMAKIGDYILIGQGGGGIQRKKKTDEKWERANDGLDALIIEDLCANNKFAFAAVLQEGVYRTENNGTTWIKKSSGISSDVRTLHATDNKIFAGTWNGLYLSEDNGESWKDISKMLPDKSINKIAYFDTCLFVATQFKGLYRSYDMGAHWTQILPDFVHEIGVYNKNLFIGSWPGIIKMSKNLGETWINTDINDYDGIITSIGFSENFIYAGGTQPGRGLWKRPLHQILPPSYKFYSTSSDTSFKGEDKLCIKSDMALKNNSGEILNSSMLSDFIKVFDGSDHEVAFTSSVDNNTKLIKVTVNSPTLNEKYKIVVQPLKNESGLIKEETTSQYFTYGENHRTAIDDKEMNPELKIYPNPASEKIELSIENQYYGGLFIEIIDLTGNILKSFNDEKSTIQFTKSISLNDVARGIYFVKVKYGNNKHEFSTKLIIQ